ncbi:MAG: carboxypeptidase-like regulatory domain-containing protein, partial [Acidimicrobiia bacterium]|nr:carboxypeptidase-like regulatory domain-containing protein [Acidimicrobiia bacterium]
DVQLTGIDLAVETTPIGPSPYVVVPAPDTRAQSLELAYEPPAAPRAKPVIIGGGATLSGTVTLPTGPAGGATIRLERHTTDGVAMADVIAGPDGTWKAAGIQGGRYRVRAWLKGQATMTGSTVFFLGGDEHRPLDFTLDPVDTTPRMSFSKKGDIYLGGTGTVAVSVKVRSVDDDGVAVTNGLAGAIITLTPTGSATLGPGTGTPVPGASATVTADGDGAARFVLTCNTLGSGTAVITHQNQRMTVDLPACIPVPPPPTTGPGTAATAPVNPAAIGAGSSPTTPTTARHGSGGTRG